MHKARLESYITIQGCQRNDQSHQNCDRLRPGGLSPEIKVSTLRHLATCQAVVLRSETKVTFDLHISFASSLSHVWVTNPYPQHGYTTPVSDVGLYLAATLATRATAAAGTVLWQKTRAREADEERQRAVSYLKRETDSGTVGLPAGIRHPTDE
jgi:hypothetical protein